MSARRRFVGEIAGAGTSDGHRVVIGNWAVSPYGAFADVMHQGPDGVRTLFAPDEAIASFVRTTYHFDAVRLGTVTVDRTDDRLHLRTNGLELDLRLGRRTALGWLLRTVPRPIATAPWWCAAIDPVARRVVDGVRTRGSAGNDRREWYGATDQHRIVSCSGCLDGEPIGALADVWPPVTFGFSSTPRTPAIVSVTTTIEMSDADPRGFDRYGGGGRESNPPDEDRSSQPL